MVDKEQRRHLTDVATIVWAPAHADTMPKRKPKAKSTPKPDGPAGAADAIVAVDDGGGDSGLVELAIEAR